MADAPQPVVQRPGADQGAVNAAQAQSFPPPAAEGPAPQPNQTQNPPPKQLEVFHFSFFSYCVY